jgi:CRISP-associated protein Cas1
MSAPAAAPDPEAGLFAQIIRLQTLEAAWEKVRANHGAAGGDGMTVEEFDIDLPTRLVRLRLALMHGTYRPGRLRRIDVAKDDGGTRPLAIPAVVDRVAQTAVALVLTPLLARKCTTTASPIAPAARCKWRCSGWRNTVARVTTGWWTATLNGIFERVPHERLLARLARDIPEPPVLGLIELWLESFSDMGPNGAGIGLPQGAPLSPLLANLYLDDVDERIAARGVRLVRFADDFLLMCRSEAAVEGARDRMAALLAEHGLRLHPDKTRIVPFEQGFRFLGHLFVRSLVVKPVAEEAAELTPANLTPDEALILARHPAAQASSDPPDGEDRAPGLRMLYVTRRGRVLTRRNQVFAVTEDGAELLAIPPARVDRIELGPGCEADDDVLRHALAHGVDVALVDGWGDTVGTLERPAGPRRHDQPAPDPVRLRHRMAGGGGGGVDPGLARRRRHARRFASGAGAAGPPHRRP